MLWDIQRSGYGVDPSLWSKIYKKELIMKHIENAKDLGIHYGEDISILYPMLLEANTIAVVHKSYYYHVQRKEGEIASYMMEPLFFEKLFSLFIYLKKILKKCDQSPVLIKQLEYLLYVPYPVAAQLLCSDKGGGELHFPERGYSRGFRCCFVWRGNGWAGVLPTK